MHLFFVNYLCILFELFYYLGKWTCLQRLKNTSVHTWLKVTSDMIFLKKVMKSEKMFTNRYEMIKYFHSRRRHFFSFYLNFPTTFFNFVVYIVDSNHGPLGYELSTLPLHSGKRAVNVKMAFLTILHYFESN